MAQKNNQTKEQVGALVIGNFDGLHLGHQALLSQAAEIKKHSDKKTVVVTFEPHPQSLFAATPPPLLTTKEEKTLLLKYRFGVDDTVYLPFDAKMAAMSAQDFLQTCIFEPYAPQQIIVGFNFRFGKNAEGDAGFLAAQAAQAGIDCRVVPAVGDEAGAYSSSRIRRAICQGRIEEANKMLGLWYSVGGEVCYGNQIGRTINFPTANIIYPSEKVVPKSGVYAALCSVYGNTWQALVNIGYRPTIAEQNKKLILEANILTDEDLMLYGDTMRVFLGYFIRDERRFANIDELKAQIGRDKKQIIDIFAQNA